MVSIYNKDGSTKPSSQYKAEVWAHDLNTEYLMLHLKRKDLGKYERKALLKEFKERHHGMSYSQWSKK